MRRLNNPPHINKEMPVRGEQKKESVDLVSTLFIVLGTGLEPAQPIGQGGLSTSCIPIPPSQHLILLHI